MRTKKISAAARTAKNAGTERIARHNLNWMQANIFEAELGRMNRSGVTLFYPAETKPELSIGQAEYLEETGEDVEVLGEEFTGLRTRDAQEYGLDEEETAMDEEIVITVWDDELGDYVGCVIHLDDDDNIEVPDEEIVPDIDDIGMPSSLRAHGRAMKAWSKAFMSGRIWYPDAESIRIPNHRIRPERKLPPPAAPAINPTPAPIAVAKEIEVKEAGTPEPETMSLLERCGIDEEALEARIEARKAAEAKAKADSEKLGRAISQLNNGGRVRQVWKLLIELGIVKNILCPPSTADTLKTELKRQLGTAWIMTISTRPVLDQFVN